MKFLSKVALLFFVLVGFSSAAELTAIKVQPEYSRIKFVINADEKYSHFFLDKPHRLVVDFKNTALKVKFPKLKNHAVLKKVRGGQRGKDYRLVFDLHGKVSVKKKHVWLEGKKTKEIVFKINAGDLISKHQASKDNKKTNIKTADERSGQKRIILVALDAGHGGSDPGAVGANGVKEKDVVLGIVKELERLLDNEPGFYSKMIRRQDRYVGLKERRDVARLKNADLFVSVHADAFPDKSVKGASVYVLSRSGASSATAKFLVENESASDKLGNIDLKGKDALLTEVLVDLAMDDKIQSSIGISKEIIQSLSNVTHVHSAQVEKAAFAVLKMPDIPSVLVESGFISNPGEAKKLSQSQYQKKLAKAIFDGIRRYFHRYPPEGSYIAWKKNKS